MQTREVLVRRLSVVSSKPFDVVVSGLTAACGRGDIDRFHDAVISAKTMAELENVVERAVGPSQLMVFVQFDAGEILRKERGREGAKVLRLLIGNPIIMKDMATSVPDAAAYAPVTILVDQRPDGVHLSYDSMASLLSPYGSEAALLVARQLDAQIESLLETAAH